MTDDMTRADVEEGYYIYFIELGYHPCDGMFVGITPDVILTGEVIDLLLKGGTHPCERLQKLFNVHGKYTFYHNGLIPPFETWRRAAAEVGAYMVMNRETRFLNISNGTIYLDGPDDFVGQC